MLSVCLTGDVKEVSYLAFSLTPPYLLISAYQTHNFLTKEKLPFSKLGSFCICVTDVLIPSAGNLQMVFAHRNGGVKGAATPVCTSALACSG